MSNPKKCHPCRAAGMQRIEFFIKPVKKNQIKAYCKENRISMSRFVLDSAIEKLEGEKIMNGLASLENELMLHRVFIRLFSGYRYSQQLNKSKIYNAGAWAGANDRPVIDTLFKKHGCQIVSMNYLPDSEIGRHFHIMFRRV